MKQLTEHIAEFEKLMNRKGFDGHFLCNASYPGKLGESLHQHLSEVLQGETHVPPFYLTTYSRWKDDESPYVLCDFKTTYDSTNGFKIDKLEARYVVDRAFNPLRKLEVPLTNNEEMPTREQVNSSVGPRKRKGFRL